MKIKNSLLKKTIFFMLGLFLLSLGLFAQPDRSNNPIAQYYIGADDSYPSWVDDIIWNNRIDMSTYSNGSTNFEKFENARDQLFSQGGGVLYYPAGTYNFTIPNHGSTGRGLMLKSGVVIVGATPTGDKLAVDDGNIQLLTKFNFSYSTTTVTRDGSSVSQEFPGMWNMVGIMPGASEQLKDVKNVGVAWIEFDGAYLYFGLQLNWATNWLASPWLGAQSSGTWGSRVADGTHPMDPFHGYAANTPYVGAGSGRLVFGCEFNNAVATNNRTTKYSGTIGTTTMESTPMFADRFAPRMGVNGSNIFIANNAIPKPTRAFRYETMVRYRKNATPYNVAPQFKNDHILFDYGDQIGIDVNKSLVGTVISSQRRDFAVSPYYENNVIVNDNYVYSHGHKGYEISGEWVMIRNNKNVRDFLQSGDNPYGAGTNWVLTMEGWDAAYETDDNMSRAFDLNGKSMWVDNNYYNNVGSNPGNDGEGILAQQHNDVDVFSWAFTNNVKGPNGDNSYMGAWSCNLFGFLIFKNTVPGGTVGQLSHSPQLFSVSVVENAAKTQMDGVQHDVTLACPSEGLSAPTNVVAAFNATKKCVVLTWGDNTANEIGYRIDRRATSSSNWKTIFYHPKVSNTDPINISNYSYTNETDVNRPEFYDYLTANSDEVEYRVAAINCNDDNSALTVSNKVTVYSGTTVSVTGVTVSPTTATLAIAATQQLTPTVTPSNASNKSVSWSSSNTTVATVNSSGLVTAVAAGSATITVTTTDQSKTATCAVTVTPSSTSYNIPGKVQAENYSAMNGIKTEGTSDTGGGLNVGWIDAGDWMDYPVNVATAGTYTINYRVASQSGGGVLKLQKGATTYHTLSVPSTGSWQTWQTISATATLDAGVQTLRIFASIAGWNINWFEGVSAATIAVTGITVSPTSATKVAGTTQQLTATITPSNATNKSVSWSSSNTAVATVNSSGLVTAVAAGSATITVTTTDQGKTATCAFTVTAAPIVVTGVTVSPTSASLAIAATQQLTATVTPANATTKTVSWSSSNTAVATVNASGLVTAVAAGSATVTVTTTDQSKTATSAINVTGAGAGSVVYAVNAGGASFTATDGTVYEADKYFIGGSTYTTGTSAIANTTDDVLYTSERYGNMAYEFPVTNGNYTVTLKFAEIYQSSAGRRQFDVAMEGVTVINNLDIFAVVGANYTAYDVVNDVTVSDGKLNIVFNSDIDKANISAILIKNDATLKSATLKSAPVATEKVFQFKAYPNPASGFITLESDYTGDTQVVFTDITGKVVIASKYSGTFKEVISISKLTPGIYLIKTISGKDVDVKKILVK